MQNVVEMLAIQTNPRAIIPCVRIFKGIYVGAKDYSAPYTLEMQFNYRSGGQQQIVRSIQALSEVRVEREIDPKNLDVHPSEVPIVAAVDPGSTMTTQMRLYINDASGARVDVGDQQNGSFVIR